MASFVNVFWLLYVVFSSFNKPTFLDLVFIPSTWEFNNTVFIGYFLILIDFHISVSLICAFIWFTDRMLNFVSIDFVLIWSLIFVPFSALSSLFWHFCISSNSLCFFSCGGAKRGWAGVPASASLPAGAVDLSKLTAPAYFFGVELMFLSVVKFGQVQKV